MLRDKSPSHQLVQLQNYSLARENSVLTEEFFSLANRLTALEKDFAAEKRQAEFFGAAFALVRAELGEMAERAGNADRLAIIDRLVEGLSPTDAVPGAPEFELRRDWKTKVTAPETPVDAIERHLAAWRFFATEKLHSAELAGLKRHLGQPGRLRIALFNSGGLGDALQLGPMLRELKKKFDPCDIAFFHTRPLVKPLFQRNHFVTWPCHIERPLIEGAVDLMKKVDLFDLAIFVQGYAPQYEKCFKSRIGGIDDDRWLAGNADTFGLLRPIFATSPRRNNLVGRMARPYAYLDLLGHVAGLPIDNLSQLSFCPEPGDADAPRRLGIVGPYLTIHDGFDQIFIQTFNIKRSTKQLPAPTWERIVEIAHRLGLSVVQLGAANEAEIKGVDVNLCGRTSLSELAFVLKQSVVHLDTEGGLVHMARAVNTRSVVWFGPTSPSFFGYHQNINIASSTCNDCWWIDLQWMGDCCRETDRVEGALGPECMTGHRLETLPSLLAAEIEAKRRDAVRLAGHRLMDDTTGDGVSAFIHMQLGSLLPRRENARIALVGVASAPLAFELAPEGAEVVVFDETFRDGATDQYTHLRLAADGAFDIEFGSPFNLPADSRAYDLVIWTAPVAEQPHYAAALREMTRLLRVGGHLLAVARSLSTDKASKATDLGRIDQALAELCGWESSLAAEPGSSGPIAVGLVLERTAAR